jgi:multidrug transporter EmrE-like cation transporter
MYLILLVFAFVCEVLAAVGVPSSSRFNLVAAGLAFYFAACIFGGAHF